MTGLQGENEDYDATRSSQMVYRTAGKPNDDSNAGRATEL